MSLIESWKVRVLVVCSLFDIELNEHQVKALLDFVSKEQEADLRKLIDECPVFIHNRIEKKELKQEIFGDETRDNAPKERPS